jgi:mycothiol synthase
MHIETLSRLDDSQLPPLRDLLAAAARADGHEPVGEHKFLRLRRGGAPDAAIVAREDSRWLGYAHVVAYGEGAARRACCEIVVHPDARACGVGTMMFERALDVAREQGAGRMDLWAYNHGAASAETAAAFAMVPSRRLLHLHRHLREAPRAPAAHGVRLRTFAPGADDDAWLDLNNRIFGHHPENGAWTIDDLHARIEQPWFDPSSFLLLEVDGALAGFCWLKVRDVEGEGRVGEIYVIGVAPEAQGRGLGRYLLAQGLAELRRRAVDVAAIYVEESNERAVALYEATGFHHHHVDVCYSLDLAGARGLAEGVAA